MKVCVDCGSDWYYQARGLCSMCYGARERNGTLEERPATRKPISLEKGDPHIRWLFNEVAAQKMSLKVLEDHSGIGHSQITKLKSKQTISFFGFKCLAEALGYEIVMMAKEPKVVEQVTD